MSKSTNRRGLALGAIFALFASVFSAAPAQAAQVDGANIAIRAEAGTSFTSLLLDDFSIYAQLKSGVPTGNFTAGNVYWEITKTGNMDVLITTSNTAAVAGIDGGVASDSGTVLVLNAASASRTVSASVSATLGQLTGLTFRAFTSSGIVSSSPRVTLTVKVFVDDQGVPNGKHDADEWFTTQVITLHPTNEVSATMTLTQPKQGDKFVTASAKVNTALNFDQLEGRFFLAMSSSADIYDDSGAAASVIQGDPLEGPTVGLRAGVISQSFAVEAGATEISASMTVSAALRYSADVGPGFYDGGLLGAVVNRVATAATVEALYTQVVPSNNSTVSSGTVAVRPNQTYTIRVGASTGSASVSGAVISVKLSGPTLTLPNRFISINGEAATTSYPAALSVTTGANGFGTFTLMTSGITASEQIVVTATQGNVNASTLTLVATTPAYSIENDYDLYSTTPGSAVTIGFSVEDQWGVATPRTDQRIQVTRGGTGFNYATTVSTVAVVGGKASLVFTPSPATATGSAKLNTVLQQYNQDLAIWETVTGGAGAEITVNVTSTAAVFATASAVLSQSASISYSVSDGVFIWTPTVTVGATGAGVDVSVSAPGLFILNVATEATASGALVVRSGATNNVEVQFASNIAGTYTVTYTLGAGSTTSTVVISPAASTSGTAISFDTTNIPSGSTRTITGTLVDMFGNPVETVGSASILVTYVGTGIVVGTMPTNTDKDGKFAFSVLVGSNDSGTALVTASYYKSGATTAVKDVLTATQQVTIGGAAAAPASDQKLTVGSFKGFVAIYALNYTGQKLSAKVAGKWLVVNSLIRFERVVRNTGAAIPIVVDLYIDGKFVRTENIVTK